MLDLGLFAKLDKLLGPARGCLMARCPWCGTRLALRVEQDAGRVVCARCGREGELVAILAEVERREARKRREKLERSAEQEELERLMRAPPNGAPARVRRVRGALTAGGARPIGR